jgi:DNA-binding GntR family transcriptional regulator
MQGTRQPGQLRRAPLPPVGDGHERLADRVFEALRVAIHDGRLPAGSRLRQEALAEELGVSRTPLREALLRLERSGLVRSIPRRGWVVAGLTRETIRHLYEARQVIEAHAVARSAQAQTRRSLADLERAYASLVEAAERSLLESFQAHREFHRELVRAYDNDVLKEELERLYDRDASLPMFALYSRDREALRSMAREHEELVEAVRSRDPDEAREAVVRHISRSLARVEAEFDLQGAAADTGGRSEGRVNGNTGI